MILFADRLITGDGKTVLENYAVCLTNGVIADVLPVAEARLKYPEKKEVALPGCTLLPAFVDLHVHLGNWTHRPHGLLGSAYMHVLTAVGNARRVFAYGVTTVREMSSPDGLVLSMLEAKRQGLLEEALPRIIPCANGICMSGGHGSFPGGADIVDGPWEVRRAIRQKIKGGHSWVKILTSHRSFFPEYTQEELNAAADECHRLGGKIAAHTGVPVSIQMCIDARIDTIEHGTFLSIDQARQMRDANLSWTPTIVPYAQMYENLRALKESQKSLNESQEASLQFAEAADAAYRENFLRLHDTGVRIGTGTDLSLDIGMGAPVGKELGYMIRYGLSALRAIEIGTSSSAGILGLEQEIGLLKVGMKADIQAVKGNPLTEPESLQKTIRVWMDGKNVYTAEKTEY